jgi:hypothetical protein
MRGEIGGPKKRPGWRDEVVKTFAVCRRTGWSYWDVRSLPIDVFDVLVGELSKDKGIWQ